jgi:hypothetical protein
MTLQNAVDHWLKFTAAGCDLHQLLGNERVRFFSFQQITTNTSDTLRGIFEFLGEPHFEPAARAFNRRINSSLADQEQLKIPPELTTLPLSLYHKIENGIIPCVREFQSGQALDFEDHISGSIDSVKRALS